MENITKKRSKIYLKIKELLRVPVEQRDSFWYDEYLFYCEKEKELLLLKKANEKEKGS